MRNLSLQRGDAFILVYDVTNAETFEEVRRIRDDIHKVRQTNTVPIVVVGNKIDLADSETREVRFVQTYIHTSLFIPQSHTQPLCTYCLHFIVCSAFMRVLSFSNPSSKIVVEKLDDSNQIRFCLKFYVRHLTIF